MIVDDTSSVTMETTPLSSNTQPKKKGKVGVNGGNGLKARRGALFPPLNLNEDTMSSSPSPLAFPTPPPTPKPCAAATKMEHPLKKRMRLSFGYEAKVLHDAFGKEFLDSIVINPNCIQRFDFDIGDYKFQYLKKNIIFKVNGGGSVNCYVTRNGSLAMFDVRREDLVVLNNILKFLLNKIDADPAHNNLKLLNYMEPQYARPDRFTTYWNHDGTRLNKLPVHNFDANVALKIFGIQYRQTKELDECVGGVGVDNESQVKLLFHLQQVRVINEDENN